MALPLFVLSIASVFFGFFFKDLFVGIASDFWQNSLYNAPEHYAFFHFEFMPAFVKFIPLVTSISGMLGAYFCYEFFFKTPYFRHFLLNYIFFEKVRNSLISNVLELYSFLINKWYFDYLYTTFFIKPFLFFGYHITYKVVDAGILYLIQPNLAKSFGTKFSLIFYACHCI
jgi:NADH-quinone oxidoreductase subunit L